jgi:hypothetical protein
MLGLLPWEKWLPPYVYGPLLCAGSIAFILFSQTVSWWEWVLLPLAACMGAAVTWVWVTTGRNLLEPDEARLERLRRESRPR